MAYKYNLKTSRKLKSSPTAFKTSSQPTGSSKRKIFTILLILGLIIVLHVVVISILVHGSREKTAREAEAARVAAAAEAEAQAIAKAEAAKAALKYKKPSDNPRFGAPFQYANAVNGTLSSVPATAQAASGILVDLGNREVLWAKNPQTAVPIASMVKMMTLLCSFEAMEQSTITLETLIQVSKAASDIGGSQVYLDPKESFPVGELAKSVAIKSANDSAYQLGEFFGGGDVNTFVQQMNRRAAELKLPNAHYINPHGLSGSSKSENSLNSAEGQARLAEELLQYPQLMQWFGTKRDTFRNGTFELSNTDHLIAGGCAGVDGMKTGYIAASGYCITTTCLRGNRRLVCVVTGMKTYKERDELVKRLLDYGYSRPASGN